jgi:hypothetical protein
MASSFILQMRPERNREGQPETERFEAQYRGALRRRQREI